MDSLGKFYKTFKLEIVPVLLKLFQKVETEGGAYYLFIVQKISHIVMWGENASTEQRKIAGILLREKKKPVSSKKWLSLTCNTYYP